MIRTADAEWKGNLKEGSGMMKLGSGAYEGQYSFKSRFENGTGRIARWWWEEDVRVTVDLLAAVRSASRRFSRYLGAFAIEISESVEPRVRAALGAR